MLNSYFTWLNNQMLREANEVIARANRLVLANVRRQFFEDDESPLNIGSVSGSVSAGKLSKIEAKAQIPKLEYLVRRSEDGQEGAGFYIEEARRNKHPNPEKEGIRQCLVKSFKSEANHLRKTRGEEIKFAPGIIVNKLNHRVYNYDEVLNKITELTNTGRLDCCDAIDVRADLKDTLRNMVFNILDNLVNFPLKLHDGTLVEKAEVVRQYMNKYRQDMRELADEKVKKDCGNCGEIRAAGGRVVGGNVQTRVPTRPGGGGGGGYRPQGGGGYGYRKSGAGGGASTGGAFGKKRK